MSSRRSGFTDDDAQICEIMMARWADDDVEGAPVNASKVASFADMARAVRESDWLAKHDEAVRADERATCGERIAVAIEARRDDPTGWLARYTAGVRFALTETARIARTTVGDS